MTKKETIQVLQSIEDRAIDFPNMTACDWVAIAAAKRHLENSLEVKEMDLEKEIKEEYLKRRCYGGRDNILVILNELQFNKIARHFFELGLKTQKGE